MCETLLTICVIVLQIIVVKDHELELIPYQEKIEKFGEMSGSLCCTGIG